MKSKYLIWIIGILILCSFASAISSSQVYSYLNLSENTISMTGLWNAAFTGTGLLWNLTGKLNKAMNLSGGGNGYIIISDFNVNAPLTINLWFRRTSPLLNAEYGNLWRWTDAAASGFDWYCETGFADDRIYCQVESGGVVKSVNLDNTSMDDGDWHMFTSKIDNTNISIWLDGVYKGGTATGNIDANNNDDLCFGNRGYNPTEQFKGYLDEASVFNYTLTQQNVTDLYNLGLGLIYPFTTDSPPTNFTVTAKTYFFNTTINTFNATINGTTYGTTSGQINTTILSDAGLFNISIFGAVNHDNITYINYNVSTNLIAYPNFSYYKLNFTAYYLNTSATGALINKPAITIFDLIANGVTYNTTTGLIALNLTKNINYTLTLDAVGYSLKNDSVLMNDWIIIKNITTYITNNILFNFINKTDFTPVYNVSIELIGTTTNYNYTTHPASTQYIDLIIPDTYTIIYNAAGFPQGYYSFAMTNRSTNNITLYFISGASNITAIVYDELGKALSNALIEVYEYSTISHNYIFSQQAQTNWQGKSILYLNKFNTFYRFYIKYGGELKLSTEPTYILDDTITFQISTIAEATSNFYTLESIDYALTFNNNTNNFRLEYLDNTGTVVTQACIELQKIVGITTTYIGSTCNAGASGIILYDATAYVQNDTSLVATAYAYWSGSKKFLTKFIQTFNVTNNTGNLGLFLIILVSIVISIIGYYAGGIAGMVVLTPLGMIFGAIAGIITINVMFVVFLEVIALIIAFLISKYD